MVSLNDPVFLKVPREWADKLDEIASENGKTTRGKWAVEAREALKEYLDNYDFNKRGKEKDAAPVEAVEMEA